MKAVILFSGGQDSTTVLAEAIKLHGAANVYPLNIHYGQRHGIESACAMEIAELLTPNPLKHVEVGFLADLGASALVGEGDVKDAHGYDEDLPASFVPNRNAAFLTIAHAYAQKLGAAKVYGGMCETDYSGYPDCRQVFIDSLESALNIGSARTVTFVTPLMYLSKAQTFQMAEDNNSLDLVLELSHTCYEGDHETKHAWGYGCGECPACQIRKAGYESYEQAKEKS